MKRNYLQIAAQYGSNKVLSYLYEKYSKELKYDAIDSLGRGIFAIANDEYTKFVLLAMYHNKQNYVNISKED